MRFDVVRAFTLASFIVYVVKGDADAPIMYATSPIIGIVFCLIIVRSEMSRSSQSAYSTKNLSSFRCRTIATELERMSVFRTTSGPRDRHVMRSLDYSIGKTLPLQYYQAGPTLDVPTRIWAHGDEGKKLIGNNFCANSVDAGRG